MNEPQAVGGLATADGTGPQLATQSRFRLQSSSPKALSRPLKGRSTLVVGAGPLASAVELKLRLESGQYRQLAQPVRRGVVHACVQVEATLREHQIRRVVLADPTLSRRTVGALIRVCKAREVEVALATPQMSMGGLTSNGNGASPTDRRELPRTGRELPLTSYRPRRSGQAAKRMIDLVAAAILLVLLSPVILGIGLAIALFSGPPIFFRQSRVGLGGRHFKILKFRTLDPSASEHADKAIAAINAGRITTDEGVDLVKDFVPAASRFGLWLRRVSLDELPQLWNVLRGDMSLVGPRPTPPFEVANLDSWHEERHHVRPGITGLWQVSGRSSLDWDVRMWLDHLYVRQWSLSLDLRILARTPLAVIRKQGAT